MRIQAVGRVVRSNALGYTNLEKKAIKRETPIKIDDLGVPLFMESPILNHGCRTFEVVHKMQKCVKLDLKLCF